MSKLRLFDGGWGGCFAPEKKAGIRGMQCMEGEDEKYDPYHMYGDAPEGQEGIKCRSTAINNDFRARMDWSITSDYEAANHPPITVLNGDKTRQVLNMATIAGSIIELSAEGSTDPDSLIYSWCFYKEPSSYAGTVTIQNSFSTKAKLEIPKDAGGKIIHLILEIHDNGTPNLYVYRRMSINVQPLSNE